MRAGYNTRMRFYRDIQDSTEVTWYEVPEDRPFIPYPTVFADWDWEEENRPGFRTPGGVGLGEQILADRTYPGGPLPLRNVFRGVFCGTREQWAAGDGLPLLPPPVYPDGFPFCCGPAQVPFPNLFDCQTLANLVYGCRLFYNEGVASVYNWVKANIMSDAVNLYSSDNGPSDIPGVLIAAGKDWQIVYISGTTTGQQFALQAMGSVAMANQITANGSGYGTSAFYQSATNFLLELVIGNLDNEKPTLFVGDSYGGALASLVAANLADTPAEWSCSLATFGAPKTGDFRFSNLLSTSMQSMISVIDDGDPVPRCPPIVNQAFQLLFPGLPYNLWAQWAENPYKRGLTSFGCLYSNPTAFIDSFTLLYILSQLATSGFIVAFQPHFTKEYYRRLALDNCDCHTPPPLHPVQESTLAQSEQAGSIWPAPASMVGYGHQSQQAVSVFVGSGVLIANPAQSQQATSSYGSAASMIGIVSQSEQPSAAYPSGGFLNALAAQSERPLSLMTPSATVYSLDFDGSSGYVDLGTAATLMSPAYSFVAWVKGTSWTNAYSSVMSKAEGSANSTFTLLIKSNGKLAMYACNFLGPVISYDGSGANTLALDTWYHLAMVYDQTVGLIGYVNGSVDGTGAPNGMLGVVPVDMRIASHPTFSDRLLDGLVNKPTVYGYALSSTQVNQLFAMTVTPESLGPIGCWPLTEGTGTVANDDSGNGNDGTLVGGVSWSTDTP